MAMISEARRAKAEKMYSHFDDNLHEVVRKMNISAGAIMEICRPLRDDDDEVDERYIQECELIFRLEQGIGRTLLANIEKLETGLQIIEQRLRENAEQKLPYIVALDRRGATVIISWTAKMAGRGTLLKLVDRMAARTKKGKEPIRGLIIADDFDDAFLRTNVLFPNIEIRQYHDTQVRFRRFKGKISCQTDDNAEGLVELAG